MSIWNPWHGCHKISPGCVNCYVYRRDEQVGRDASRVVRTRDYDLPLRKDSHGKYKLTSEGGTVYTCMTSDFFLEEADDWRASIWDMIRLRQDLHFHIITKRIQRFYASLPDDWGDGWDHVTLCATVENQEKADEKIPVLLDLPVKHREMICEPMLGKIFAEKYLKTGKIEHVTCGGESGRLGLVRSCDLSWILEMRRECIRCQIPFTFKQTGTSFIKNGVSYYVERELQQAQAKKSGYSYTPGTGCADRIKYALPDRDMLFADLAKSEFRRRFFLTQEDRKYIEEKGQDVIRRHTEDFVRKRLAPENPENDGKQTPMHGHPAFTAQHATACCCRSCLEKWHHIPAGKELTREEQNYIVDIIMYWIEKEYGGKK